MVETEQQKVYEALVGLGYIYGVNCALEHIGIDHRIMPEQDDEKEGILYPWYDKGPSGQMEKKLKQLASNLVQDGISVADVEQWGSF